MGKKDNKKKVKGAEKTAVKTAKKAQSKLNKSLAAKGEENIESLIASFVESDRKKERVAEDLVEPPSPRSGCTLVASPDKDLLYLFGGSYFNGQKTFMYNELFTYNIKKNSWLKLSTPLAPPPRCSHQAVVVAQSGGQMWIFGGEFASPTQSQFYHYKDLWCYHVQEKRWEKVDAPGGPSSRSGHRMVTNGKDIFVFGGFHETVSDAKYFNDIYRFTIADRKWTRIEPVGQGPTPRSGVQLSVMDNRILLYGGYAKEKSGKNAERGVTFTDMYYLSEDKIGKWKWTQVKQGGTKPSPRSGMAIVTGSANKAYVFGGVCDDEDDETIRSQCMNDFYLLETDKGLWKQLELRQERPKATGETEEAVDTKMEDLQIEEPVEEVKTDGVFTVKISSVPTTSSGDGRAQGEQKVEVQKKFVPHPRMSACLAMKHGILYLYGGIFESGDKQYTLRDMYCIDLHKMDQWKPLVELNEKELEWFDSDSESDDSEGGDEEMDDSGTDDGSD